MSSSAWRRAATFLGLAGIAFAGLRCALLAGLSDHYIATPDAAPDAGAVDLCSHAEPPPPPQGNDGTEDQSVLFAVRTIDLGVAEDASAPSTPLGYDLDDTCTCPAPGLCAWRAGPVCDDDAGRDDSFGSLFTLYIALSQGGLAPATFNLALSNGEFGILVFLEHYNGGADDPSVEVTLYGSTGTETPDGGAADAGQPVPKWDGNDVWTEDLSTAVGLFADPAAYVTNHVLVAHLPGAPGPFPLRLYGHFQSPVLDTAGSVKIAVSGGIVTATIVADGPSTYHLEGGQIAGRFPTARIPELLNEVDPGLDSGTICPGTDSYNQIKPSVCAAADLNADPDGGDGGFCDAISLAVGFTAYPARIGSPTVRPILSTCPEAGVESCQ